MSKYILSINIHAESKELLENLMVTLETISDDINQLNMIELFSVTGPDSVSFDTRPRAIDKSASSHDCGYDSGENNSNVMQRCLFLDKWMFL